MREGRTLGMVLIIIYLVIIGFMRTFFQLLIIDFNLVFFLTLPSLPLIQFALSISYMTIGFISIRSWRTGSIMAIVAITVQVFTEYYMAITFYGLSSLLDISIVYSPDMLILFYLVRSLKERSLTKKLITKKLIYT